MAAEDVAVRSASLLQSILQGAGNVLLSDNFGELLRTIFARQDGIAHEPEESIIRDRSGDGRAAISLGRLAKSKQQGILWCVNPALQRFVSMWLGYAVKEGMECN